MGLNEVSIGDVHILNRIAMLSASNNLDNSQLEYFNNYLSDYAKKVALAIKNKDYTNSLAKTFIDWAKQESSITTKLDDKSFKWKNKLLSVCSSLEEKQVIKDVFERLER